MTQSVILSDDLETLTLSPDLDESATPETQPAPFDADRRPTMIEFYFDFLCPFSYRAMQWLSEVRSVLDDDPTDDYLPIQIAYHYFSIEQYARATGDQHDTDIWGADVDGALRYGADGYIWRPPHIEETTSDAELQPPVTGTPPTFKGLLPFVAGEAARRQSMRPNDALGERGIELYYKALGSMRHEDGLIIWDRDVIELAAEKAKFDVERFRRDLDDPEVRESVLRRLERDHTRAVEFYGATETPLLVIGDEEPRPMHLKVMPNPSGSKALALFTHILGIVTGENAFLELVIPQTAADKTRVALLTERSQRGLEA